MEFRPIGVDAERCARYGELFATCYAGKQLTPAYLRWEYDANPDGQAIGFDAWDGDRLAAHYVCLPAHGVVNGRQVRLLLSLNTATHPAYQRQGLFTKLAEMTYGAGADQGFDAVYGVANANSTPGMVRNLWFQLVCQLDARIGMGPLPTASPAVDLSFARRWSKAGLLWRCANPSNRVAYRQLPESWQFFADSVNKFLPVYAELTRAEVELPASAIQPAVRFPRLFLGLIPKAKSFGAYVNIPRTLRPRPLNMIYRSLTPRDRRLEPSKVRFSFLDFDAY
jgi:GNAT superfamily N-acetyltransferase